MALTGPPGGPPPIGAAQLQSMIQNGTISPSFAQQILGGNPMAGMPKTPFPTPPPTMPKPEKLEQGLGWAVVTASVLLWMFILANLMTISHFDLHGIPALLFLALTAAAAEYGRRRLYNERKRELVARTMEQS